MSPQLNWYSNTSEPPGTSPMRPDPSRRYLPDNGALPSPPRDLRLCDLSGARGRFPFGDLDRRDQVADGLVKAHRVGGSARRQVFDRQVIRVPVIVVGQHASARQAHTSSSVSGPIAAGIVATPC